MTKKKILTYSSLLVFTLLFGLGVSQADAFWGGNKISLEERTSMQETMFKEQASFLGLTLDEVKNAWASGQSMLDLAKSKGVTEEALRAKMQTARQEMMKQELKALVDKGVITQAQADARLKHMETMKGKMVDSFGKNNNGKARGHMNWIPGGFNF